MSQCCLQNACPGIIFFHATKGEKQVVTAGLTSQEVNVFNDVNKIHLRK